MFFELNLKSAFFVCLVHILVTFVARLAERPSSQTVRSIVRDRALEMVRWDSAEMVRGDSRVTWYYVPKRPQDITTLKKQT